MVIKNVSGEARYFGFGRGARAVRGRIIANNAESTVPDNDPYVFGQVQEYVSRGMLQIIQGPAQAHLVGSKVTPAYGYVQANGAVANDDRVTVAGIVYEFKADPGGAVLGQYHAGLANVAYKWAGAGAAAVTAVGTLRTAINVHTATTNVLADAAVQYDTGLYLLPLRRSDGRSSVAGTGAVAVVGANLAMLHGGLVAGIDGGAIKEVSKVHVVSATDVTNAAILLATGLTSISAVMVTVRTAAGIAKEWNGATLISGGNVVLNNAGLADWAATDIINIVARGV